MESLVNAVSQVPLEAWLIIAVAFLVLLLGYTIGARILGFGRHVVKETDTFEYDDPDAIQESIEERKPPKQHGRALPQNATKRSITTESQSSRTFWDWLALLTISAVIAGAALWFTSRQAQQQLAFQAAQASQQRDIQARESQDAAFQSYLDQMSNLILNHDLSNTNKESVHALARSRTLTVVRGQGPKGKADVVNFLHEAGLIKADQPSVKLDVAHLESAALDTARLNEVNLHNSLLSNTKFHWADLHESDLSEADLNESDLSEADLRGADLSYADLHASDLHASDLSEADLRGADLSRRRKGNHPKALKPADLSDAKLKGTNLSCILHDGAYYCTDLSGTDLSGADFSGANLRNADMSGAKGWTVKQLTAAKTLEGATMPDGQRLKSKDNPDGPTFEEWLKSREEDGG
jgi:uncharacterized protein YjbI with pentapeptide repeats